MSLPKLPLRIDERQASQYWIEIVDALGVFVDGVRSKSNDGWPIPDARQAAERRLAELTRMIEDATPKCPIRKGHMGGASAPNHFVRDANGDGHWFHAEAERDAVYDALVALWHKENGT